MAFKDNQIIQCAKIGISADPIWYFEKGELIATLRVNVRKYFFNIDDRKCQRCMKCSESKPLELKKEA